MRCRHAGATFNFLWRSPGPCDVSRFLARLLLEKMTSFDSDEPDAHESIE